MFCTKDRINECTIKSKSSGLEMAFFDSIHFVPPSWDELIGDKNVYLTTKYLSAIENTMKQKMGFRYVILFKETEAVALASYQLISVDASSLELEPSSKSKKLVGKILNHFDTKCLINGSLFSSGENGFYYSSEIPNEVAFDALAACTTELCTLEDAQEKIKVMMVKDYFPENTEFSKSLINYKYRNFLMEPNMVLEVKEEWQSMEDYFASMTTKYRKKAKTNLKKAGALTEKVFTTTEIEKYLPQLRALFLSVHNKAKHKLGAFDVSAFLELKQNLEELFILKGYFLDTKLVGFSTGFINNGNLEANYVGIDYEFNKTHNVYLRILYDYVKLGLEKKVNRVYFGRTAGEIKSNLGAKAVDMECYVRTKNSVSNKIIKPLVQRISTPEFVERNPFKEMGIMMR